MIDRLTFRLVVLGIVVICLASLTVAVVLTLEDYDASQAWTIAVAALTAVAGLLVSPKTESEPGADPAAAALHGYHTATADLTELAAAEADAAVVQVEHTPAID